MGWLSQTRPIPRSPDGDNNAKWPIQVHEYIFNFVLGIDLFSKENDNEQGKGDQKLDMGDIWLVEEK